MKTNSVAITVDYRLQWPDEKRQALEEKFS